PVRLEKSTLDSHIPHRVDRERGCPWGVFREGIRGPGPSNVQARVSRPCAPRGASPIQEAWQRRKLMSRRQLILFAAVVVTVMTIRGSGSLSAGTSSPAPQLALDPANFVTVVDNPYFPLPVGRTWVYEGIKDGQTQIDTVIVTSQTKTILGIAA